LNTFLRKHTGEVHSASRPAYVKLEVDHGKIDISGRPMGVSVHFMR
jgi:hypothetical protein